MKKVSFIILCLLISLLPCSAKDISDAEKTDEAPKIFIYHIPDELESENPENEEIENLPDIVSDDITADTTPENYYPDAVLIPDENEDYELSDMYTDVLKGYAEYNEYDEDAIILDDDIKNFQALNIKLPAKVVGSKYVAQSSTGLKSNSLNYSKFNNVEYSIAPMSSKNYRKKGGFSAGTTYSQGIDFAELEQSTGIFSRYENKYFAINTAYAKTINTTNNNYNDNFYFSPELKINQYFTLKQILSADITRNRKKAEVVLSINPFGRKDENRLWLEIGANATYDDTNTLLKNQLKFSTKFNL